jgi:hypothetical protein
MEMTPFKAGPALPTQNWTDLEPNGNVQVVDTDGASYTAVVDDISDDSTLVWIRRQDDWSRHLIEHRAGIRIIPQM